MRIQAFVSGRENVESLGDQKAYFQNRSGGSRCQGPARKGQCWLPGWGWGGQRSARVGNAGRANAGLP